MKRPESACMGTESNLTQKGVLYDCCRSGLQCWVQKHRITPEEEQQGGMHVLSSPESKNQPHQQPMHFDKSGLQKMQSQAMSDLLLRSGSAVMLHSSPA